MPEMDNELQVAAGQPPANGRPAAGYAVGWNFAIITLDVTCWMAGLACVDAAAVLPVFLRTVTDSPLLIAALCVMPGAGWALLQVVGVSLAMHRPRKKGYVLAVAALGRAPMALVPLVLLFHPGPSRGLILAVLVAASSVLYLTDGLVGAAWYDIIGKTIPARLRGRFFGSMNVLSALAALAAGVLVRWVLANPALPYPRQYGVLFGCFFLGIAASFVFLTLIREPAGAAVEEPLPVGRVLAAVPALWRGNPRFRRLLVVAWLGNLAGLAWPFYVLYGMQALHLPVVAGAVFIWGTAAGTMLGSALWAWVNDRHGPRWVVVGTAALRAAPAVLAVAVPLLTAAWPALRAPAVAQYAYALVFLAAGMVASGGMIGFPNYLLELAPAKERPLYIGLGNTLTAPGLLAPVLGGWLAGLLSYQAVFGLAVATAVVCWAMSLGLGHVEEAPAAG